MSPITTYCLILHLLSNQKLQRSNKCNGVKYLFIMKLPWVDFQVVVAGYCVDLNFLLWGSLERKNTNHRCNWQFDFELMKKKLHAVRQLRIGQGDLVTVHFIICPLTTTVWCSMRSFSTPAPYSSLSRHMMRVFFPAPDGPYTNKCGKSPHWTWNKHKETVTCCSCFVNM